MKKLAVIFLALLMLYPMSNLLLLMKEDTVEDIDTQEGVSYIQNIGNADVALAQDAVDKAEKIRNYVPETKEQKVQKLLKKLDKGKITYRKALKDVYIVGDSLMNGLECYNILNPNKLLTQVSASLYHLSDNIDKIKSLEPPILLLHYGVNMIGTKDSHLEFFISMYTDIIKELQEALPDTRIIISSLFPVDRSIATGKRFENIHKYNKALKKMCKELNVDFLSNAGLFKDIEYCYGSDGIHFSEKFYRNYWLRYLIEKMEIV